MSLTTISGTVAAVRQSSSEQEFGEMVGTHNVFTFRVKDQSVQIRSQQVLDIHDGDQLTIVGSDRNGTFRGLAFRNEVTGVTWCMPAQAYLFLGVVIIVFSLPLILFLIGIPSAALGIFIYKRGAEYSTAMKMLQASRGGVPDRPLGSAIA